MTKRENIDGLKFTVEMLEQEPKTVLYSGDGYADGYMVYNMAECPNCGYKYEDGDKDWGLSFCPNCGQKLNWESEDTNELDDKAYRDFKIGDEVRIIGSDPIYDDCDVGWVVQNASEKARTMYVMRNDGSAGEEIKAEWYKTGRHNNALAEAIKALPYGTEMKGIS